MAINKNNLDASDIVAVRVPCILPAPQPGSDKKVGMGDLVVSRAPDMMSIIGLGSCVGVALYYPKEQIGGLAHIMLPDSSRSRGSASREKFADTGLAIMLDRLKRSGADPVWMTARLVGGASMFKNSTGFSSTGSMFNIGENNVLACREFLKKERIKIIGEDVMGTAGRTMRFNLATGKVYVRYANGTGIEL